nr:MAG: helix-turn-helix domain protein [Bacteriophage sp.]
MLKKLRGNKTKVDFAKSLGISKQLYQLIENGRHKELPLSIVQKLKNRYDLTPEQVLELIGIR